MVACEIINWGNPKATIQWKRPEEQHLSDYFVTTNETHTSLTLPNVTQLDGGKYVCCADTIVSKVFGELYLYLQGLYYIWNKFRQPMRTTLYPCLALVAAVVI